MAETDVHLTDFANIFSLKSKVAVVTGGSRGLGLHAASGLLQAGCTKIFITSRKVSACTAAVAALNALATSKNLPGRAYAVPADVSNVAEIEKLVQEVSKETDYVDILFANAGATWGSRFEDVDETNGWDKVMDLNVKGVFFTVQKFAPLLQKRATVEDPSRVVITSSVASFTVHAGPVSALSYSTSKAAVTHLARNLALELAPRNILTNVIAPGFFPSKMANNLIAASGGVEKLGRQNPNGRLGRAEDVAATVVYLCSRAGGHVNGDVVVLDGGRWLGTVQREKGKL
ncbi:hypothetical protein N0V90_011759 [Kalmusia sp. IMI 367209]|nr:hypothetical protein N0V90_011759 [Kalmusia sp. IMI 367209]